MAYFSAEMMEDTNGEFFILTRRDLRGKLEGKLFPSFFAVVKPCTIVT